MKVLDIAFKDMLQSFRSLFAVVMMFVAPLVTTAVIYFAFGGLASGDEGWDIPKTQVVVANLDTSPGQAGFSPSGLILTILESDDFQQLFSVTQVNTEAEARDAVDAQEAGVAVIIPEGFNAATFDVESQADIIIYQDPTLTIGPSILQDLVSQIMDGFSGAKIAVQVVSEQSAAQGRPLEPASLITISMDYGQWASGLDQESLGQYLSIASPQKEAVQPTDFVTELLGGVMAAMAIYYMFFSGAASAQSIVREEEEGTLARLFTTPLRITNLFAGKFLAAFMTTLVQVIVLAIASRLLFGIHWGSLAMLIPVFILLSVLTSTFGIFLISLIKNSKQVGVIYGGVLTITGMMGGLFTSGIPNPPAILDKVKLAMPQGWAFEALTGVIAGQGWDSLALPFLVILAMSLFFFGLAVLRLRKRFA